ncbi:MAG TPA: DUF3857 and transglutaminase domain-containing protein [Blastocatellia bacterium]|nr:DUF3857 and transglutaminase domain-containing protein [Blastocatellia bacterium]
MKIHHSFIFTPTAMTCLLVCLIFLFTPAQAQAWKPMDPAHLALKAPVVEKDADAEALLWEVYVNDASENTEYIHLLRVKIFSERGKESQSKIDIPYFNRTSIKDISGRTVKPDGSIVELKKDAIFDREIVRFGGVKLKAKSFAMPGVEPGSIIEYRWREVVEGGVANNVPLYFQREIPVQTVRYYLKPSQAMINPMKTITFAGNNSGFVKDKDGYFRTEMTNLPAFHEEPRMPPADQVRTWMLVYYASDVNRDPMTYWKDLGKRFHELIKGEMKVNDDIRRAATEAVGDAATPEQKLERLFNFCRTKIKNVNDDASGLTADQLKKMKENKSPAETLKRGYGTGGDIDFLFAAMATAAGFEARYAMLSDRSRRFFDPNFTNPYFMRAYNIAVKVGDKWQFFDPASTYVPYGMLRWQEEGIQALVCDAKEPQFAPTQLSPAEKSVTKRTAKLKLGEDGALEGEVRVEYTGHFAVSMKEDYDEETADQREKKLRDQVKERLGADISEIKIESANDPVKPFAYSYKISVPGYAERTGKRLFIQPAFFQKGLGQMFPTSSRQHDIYFSYPWVEEDKVVIELPEGYALDNAESPGDLAFGEIGYCKTNLGVTQDQRTLEYKRNFRFTGLIFPKATYPNLKQAFDVLHQRDNHTITLKQGAAGAAKP